MLFTSCVDLWKLLVCCSGHAKFQADECGPSLRMGMYISLKLKVGSCISTLIYICEGFPELFPLVLNNLP